MSDRSIQDPALCPVHEEEFPSDFGCASCAHEADTARPSDEDFEDFLWSRHQEEVESGWDADAAAFGDSGVVFHKDSHYWRT